MVFKKFNKKNPSKNQLLIDTRFKSFQIFAHRLCADENQSCYSTYVNVTF